MDKTLILTMIGTGVAILGFIYGILRNFKSDINSHIDRLQKEIRDENRRMDQRVMETNMRMDGVYHLITKKLKIDQEA